MEMHEVSSRQAGWFDVPQLTRGFWNDGSLEVFCLGSLFLTAKLSFQVLFFFLNKCLRAGLWNLEFPSQEILQCVKNKETPTTTTT